MPLIDGDTAFRSIAHRPLVIKLKPMAMDGDIVWWTECILSERMVEMIMGNNAITRYPVEVGVL
jgi:hypothetical protein